MCTGKLLVRNGWALRILRLSVWWAGKGDILIYDKWLLVKLSLSAKYVIIISGQVQREYKCFSDTIRLQFEDQLKPFSSVLSRTQNNTDKKMDKQTDRQNPHEQNERIAPYWKAGNQLTRDH